MDRHMGKRGALRGETMLGEAMPRDVVAIVSEPKGVKTTIGCGASAVLLATAGIFPLASAYVANAMSNALACAPRLPPTYYS